MRRTLLILPWAIWLSAVDAAPAPAQLASAEALGEYLTGVAEVPPAWADDNEDGVIDAADIVSLLSHIFSLSVSDVSWDFSPPYLLDFHFTMRQGGGVPAVLAPELFDIQAYEQGNPISPTETAVLLAGSASKVLRSFLVLDYSLSMASLANGDSDGDGLSDAVETMQDGCRVFIAALNEDAQTGIFEFHSDDDPQMVSNFTTSAQALNDRIDRIWFDQVQQSPGNSHCWDAVYAAVEQFGAANRRDERRFIVFLSDGVDESSIHTPEEISDEAVARGVKIYCIGFGAELDPTELQRLTAATNGEYYEADNLTEMTDAFYRIIADLAGQYTLRWATLRRDTTPFLPGFQVRHEGSEAIYLGPGPYVPANYAGNTFAGALRLVGTEPVSGEAKIYLRAEYIPRNVRRIVFRIRTPRHLQHELVTRGSGGIIPDWTVTASYNWASQEYTFDLRSPNPSDLATSIPYGSFGPMLAFRFRHLPTLASFISGPEQFHFDNTIYAGLGNQSMELTNIWRGFDRNGLAGNFAGAEEVITGLINEDAIPDVIAGGSNGALSVFYANGRGGFTRQNIGGFAGLDQIALYGRDIVISSPLQYLAWWHQKLDPQTQLRTWEQWPVSNQIAGTSGVAVGDIDLDGDLDIVAGSPTDNHIHWFERVPSAPPQPYPDFIPISIVSGFNNPVSCRTIDFEGDGDIDIVAAAHGGNRVSLFTNQSEAFTQRPVSTTVQGPRCIQVVDMDRDGDLDILCAAEGSNSIVWWANMGNYTFSSTRTIDTSFPGVCSVFAADIDTDGDIDFAAAARAINTVAWYENDGYMRFTRRVLSNDYLEASGVCVEFLDEDEYPDILSTAFGNNEVTWWRNGRAFRW
ncbi:MAG: VCBS repeat-containing protein [Candidatus Sumerlaeia bacterium]|nr:VCBS repeat-containing protein [Candidatus Sumerlaeia bacterium]